MSNQWLAFDFDGVITSPHALKAHELHKLGYHVPASATSRDCCVRQRGVPLDVYETATFRANCLNLEEVPLEVGAKESLESLNAWGYAIAIVTSRTDDEMPFLERYLQTKGIQVTKILNTSRRHKSDVLAGISPLLYVDDTIEKLEEVRRQKPELKLFFFANEANQYCVANLQRTGISVGGWRDILELIRLLPRNGGSPISR